MSTSALALGDEVEPEDRVARTRILLESYTSATERGLVALNDHDLDAVESVLRERQQTLELLAPLLEALALGSAPEADRGVDIDRLLSRTREAQKLDMRLTIALAAELQRISQELGMLDDEETIRGAYGQTSPAGGRTINLVR